jgi:hypothetical protein
MGNAGKAAKSRISGKNRIEVTFHLLGSLYNRFFQEETHLVETALLLLAPSNPSPLRLRHRQPSRN